MVELAPRLKADGIAIRGVRIDSGDLTAHGAQGARHSRRRRAASDVIILVSGGINEDVLQTMMKAKAPIDGFGIGVNLAASVDVPALDCAYKLQEYAGKPKRKLSEGKATWPGRKQVWRAYDADGRMRGDILSLESDKQPGEPLIVPVMRAGKRIAPAPTLAQIRERAARDLARLAGPLARLESGVEYPVQVADALTALAKEIGAKARKNSRVNSGRREAAARIQGHRPLDSRVRGIRARMTVISRRPPCSSRARPRRKSRGRARSPPRCPPA